MNETIEKPKTEQTVKQKVIIAVHRQISSITGDFMFAKIKRDNIIQSTYVYLSPTGDCQTFSISNLQSMLPTGDKELDMEILARCYQVTGKNQLLVNICTDTKTMVRFKEIFNGFITIEQNYNSTRGSAMTMFLVRTTPLLRWLEENNKTGEIKYHDDKA